MVNRGDLSELLAVDDAVAKTLAEAQALVARHPPKTLRVALWESRGMVLARDVLADRDQPPFSRSAMDGWAFRASDVSGPTTLAVIGEVAAGEVFDGEVGSGQAVAIMTGAPVPRGADTVEMKENAHHDGPKVVIHHRATAGKNIRAQGEDCAASSVAVERGRILDGLTCGVVATMGVDSIEVFERPRVSVLATGSELVRVADTPKQGQIRESNRHTLFGMLGDRCRTVDGGLVPDDVGALRLAIREHLASAVVVLSGGVSAGNYDLVADALKAEGCTIVFHKARIKPGKPLLVARHERGLVFGLPGNPVSTFVTAQLFLLPALRVLAGRREPGPWSLTARLEAGLAKTGARTTFDPGYLYQREGVWHVRPVPFNGSGDLVGFAHGNCLIRRAPKEPAHTKGGQVQVILPRPPVSF